MRGLVAASICALTSVLMWSAAPAVAQGERKPAIALPRDPPLPPPRPAERATPAKDLQQDVKKASQEAPREVAEPPDSKPPGPSACQALLTERGALFTPVSRPKDQAADDPCAVDDGVSLKGVRVSDSETVALDGAVTVRCALAAELALWVRDDLSAIARRHGRALRKLVGVGGQECRGRNRQSGARLSEHAIGNAFDVHKIELDGGRVIDLMQDRDDARRSLREEIRASACARFPTVLGTGSDGFHEDHLHVDLRARRGGYRLCQWDISLVRRPTAP